MSFNNQSYEIIKQAVPKELCTVAAREFEICKDLAMYANASNKEFPYHDEMVDNSFSWYSPMMFEALSDTLIKNIVENVLGEPVYPTYSYARIYYPGAVMHRHIDRSSSEVSASLCIKTDADFPWHLGMEDKNGQTFYVEQEPGDMVVYDGNELYHWRDPYTGTAQINAFFFFVKANGPRSDLKFDTRPLLGMPSEFRRLNSEEQRNKYSGT